MTSVLAAGLGTHVLPTYPRADVCFVEGDGVWLVDADGRRYLDFLAGIAVVGLGHRHPAVTAAAHAQLDRLWHVSNLFWTLPMAELAERLSARLGGGQAFFCNSGAEAIEAALKYARKATGKTGIVALEGSFHGRTLGALSATGQPAKHAGFGPLVPDVRFAALNDAESLAAAAADGNVACVLIEPVQGEGGINPATPAFLESAAELAHGNGGLLVFDEVQCGVGRTGTFFAHEQLGVRPDAVTLAKGLANGLPIGALLVADEAAGGFQPGDHASTFGGNPVTCAAACAVLDALDEELLVRVRQLGATLAAGLAALPAVREVRGLGLLVGCELDRPAGPVATACLEHGLVVGTAGERVLRLTPPLVATGPDVELALATLAEVLG
ncbi:MAG: acetylornithine/succinylornithine family transaminase [Thermoleophilia bacterium]|nr:acetylornithine/succinylornithine family transaminase [Thermoleophilia bacterium]